MMIKKFNEFINENSNPKLEIILSELLDILGIDFNDLELQTLGHYQYLADEYAEAYDYDNPSDMELEFDPIYPNELLDTYEIPLYNVSEDIIEMVTAEIKKIAKQLKTNFNPNTTEYKNNKLFSDGKEMYSLKIYTSDKKMELADFLDLFSIYEPHLNENPLVEDTYGYVFNWDNLDFYKAYDINIPNDLSDLKNTLLSNELMYESDGKFYLNIEAMNVYYTADLGDIFITKLKEVF